MKRSKVAVLAVAAAVCAALCLAGCASNHYEPAKKTQTVADSALKKPGVLRVGVNASAAPLAGKASSSSKIVGLDVDIAAAVADELGVKVEIVDAGSDPASALRSGDVDMVLGADVSSTDTDYWRSNAYLQTGVALFSAKEGSSAPRVTDSVKIGAQVSSKSAWSVENLFGSNALTVEESLAVAFKDLKAGAVDYVASDALTGVYLAKTSGVDASVVALLQQPGGYCAGVSTSNLELQKAVSSALSKLASGGVIEVIERKWLGQKVDIASLTVISGSGATTVADQSDDSSDKGETPSSTDAASSDTAASTGSTSGATGTDTGSAVSPNASASATSGSPTTVTQGQVPTAQTQGQVQNQTQNQAQAN
ncbi:substrate-binding periplasmic protein [Berryella intestinalis]|uniref:substrate-binding periplasmic protein n=1 Tax=Berryella intestinalis TaxID=1531429 RepID=UPI0006897075|nr:transporter substrate-binding domain-containing protein [Berryella intestinalis]